MNFRESINNLIRSDRPESTSRALALATGLFILAWITYALLTDKLAGLLPVVVALLTWINVLLGLKQYSEKKDGDNANQPPPAT